MTQKNTEKQKFKNSKIHVNSYKKSESKPLSAQTNIKNYHFQNFQDPKNYPRNKKIQKLKNHMKRLQVKKMFGKQTIV